MSHNEAAVMSESSPMTHVEFHVKEKSGTEIIREAEVDLEEDIEHVKEDLAPLFGSKQQIWYYKGQLLDNDKSLANYKLDYAAKRTPIIQVTLEDK